MGPMAGMVGSLLAYLVIVEGGLALWDQLQGDPEGDVESALQRIGAENQLNATAAFAAEQRGEERIQGQFAGFNPLAVEALTSASQLQRPETARRVRGGREVRGMPMGGGTELLDFVASKLGMTSDDLRKRSAPGRAGDFTGLSRAVGGSIPTE